MEDLDHMAKRYGKKPSDFLKDDVREYQFNMLVASVGNEAEIKAQKQAAKRSSARGKTRSNTLT